MQDGLEMINYARSVVCGRFPFKRRQINSERLFPSGPESSHQNPEDLIERCQSRPWMSSFQYPELLTKGQVFKKKPTTSTEEPDKFAYQESDGTYHAMGLWHSACGGNTVRC
jgi:hypothetical protein